ncbi:MAG: PEGA domain-containing protein [Patescibacteria group bacterium]
MRIVQRLLFFSFFVGIFLTIVAYARGYRLDLKQRSVTPTGIIAVTSSPKAGKIYINGEFKGATDTSFTLPPGKYTVEVKKDGFTDWKRDIVLKGELVMTADALLFPLNASLTPLTNLGVGKIVLVDQTGKLLLFTQTENEEKDGIYIFDQSKKPFALFPPLKPLILKKNLPAHIDLLSSNVIFSPDYKEGIFEFVDQTDTLVAYDIAFDEEVQAPFDVTTSMDSITAAWETERQEELVKILETLPKDMRLIASDSFRIISFAPDKTKFLYEATEEVTLAPIINPPLISANQEQEERSLDPGTLYIYDIREDKNFRLDIKDADFNDKDWKATAEKYVFWYPDSRHLVLNEHNQVSIIEYDNTNRQAVYSGPHELDFLDITSDGKLLILANLNPQTNKSPDLYVVGIR